MANMTIQEYIATMETEQVVKMYEEYHSRDSMPADALTRMTIKELEAKVRNGELQYWGGLSDHIYLTTFMTFIHAELADRFVNGFHARGDVELAYG